MSNMTIRCIKDALKEEIARAWSRLQAQHGSQAFYAFGIYCNDVASWFNVIALTEEGLAAVAAEYAQRQTNGDRNLNAVSLRWSLADSPLFPECDGLLPISESIRNSQPDPYDGSDESEKATNDFFNGTFQALSELDQAGTFGEGAARSNLLLSVWLNDESDESRIAAASRLNSNLQVTRYAKELADAYSAFVQLASQ